MSNITTKDENLEPKKPNPKKYGYHEQQGFDDEPSGWMIEGGQDAYYKALREWEEFIIDKNNKK